MRIYINNQQQEITPKKNITTLLKDYNIQSERGVAIAVNDQVVPKTDWTNFELQENDKVLIITATQGG